MKNVLAKILKRFINLKDNNIPSELKILTTIQDFEFVSSSIIRQDLSLSTLTENILIKLYEENISTLDSQNSIKSKLTSFLGERSINQAEISKTIFQIDKISKNDLEYILNNFDIIQFVQGLRYLRITPNQYGNSELNIGLNITINKNVPIVAILDTGITDDPSLQSL